MVALADFVAPDDFAEIAAATGAMLVGRRTWDVGDRMEAEEPGSVDYPFSGPMFLLTHRPLELPDPDVTILTGDIGEAVATALDAASGKDLEILGADVAGQCLQPGLVDEILVYVLPGLLGDGIRFSRRASADRPGTDQQRALGRCHHAQIWCPHAVSSGGYVPVTFDHCDHIVGPFYHGTKSGFRVGDELVPGHGSNFQEGRVSNHIYFSALVESAAWGAELATSLAGIGERGHIYVVEPEGELEDDPNVTDKRFPGNPTQVLPHPPCAASGRRGGELGGPPAGGAAGDAGPPGA